jgi:hypothetical protein
VNENDSSFLPSVVADEKVPPCLRRSGFAQAGLKLFQYPRSPSVRIDYFTSSQLRGMDSADLPGMSSKILSGGSEAVMVNAIEK